MADPERLLSQIELRDRRRPGMVAVLSVVDRQLAAVSTDARVEPVADLLFELLKPAGRVRQVSIAPDAGHLVVFVRDVSLPAAQEWLSGVVSAIATRRLVISGLEVRLTPVVGVAKLVGDLPAAELVLLARDGWVTALSRLDLQPVRGRPPRGRPAPTGRRPGSATTPSGGCCRPSSPGQPLRSSRASCWRSCCRTCSMSRSPTTGATSPAPRIWLSSVAWCSARC